MRNPRTTTGEQPIRLETRLPKALHTKLKADAKKNIRSLNAEIVYRLLKSYGDVR